MNAELQIKVAARLREALAQAGILVESSVVRGANVVGHQDVPAEALIGVWAQKAWKISLVSPNEREAEVFKLVQ